MISDSRELCDPGLFGEKRSRKTIDWTVEWISGSIVAYPGNSLDIDVFLESDKHGSYYQKR